MNEILLLNEDERNLILFLREMGWGEVHIEVQNGCPNRIIESRKSIILKGLYCPLDKM